MNCEIAQMSARKYIKNHEGEKCRFVALLLQVMCYNIVTEKSRAFCTQKAI